MDRSRVLQLKTDLKHREDALRQQLAGAGERPNNGAGGSRKLQGGVHSRQREGSEEWRDLKEEERAPERYQASRAPQIQGPKEEGAQEEKATRRTTPKTALRAAREGQEAKTVVGRGGQHKGGMVVVSDRAKKATLVKLLGMDATVVVMPQGQLAKIVKRNIHMGNCKKNLEGG